MTGHVTQRMCSDRYTLWKCDHTDYTQEPITADRKAYLRVRHNYLCQKVAHEQNNKYKLIIL